jgi:23S rRNA pseudouridine1911/1915/1917 synthase
MMTQSKTADEAISSDYRELHFRIRTYTPHQRLDSWLAQQIGGLSRSRIQSLIAQGLVTVEGKTVKPSYQVKWDNQVVVRIPGPKPSPLIPEDIPLDIRFEDEHLIVVNKPAGMVVHPACGHRSGTLVNALLHHCRDLAGIGGELRPGLVHRLDKDTSGLLVIAKDERTLNGLAKQFREKTTERIYRALVWGHPDPPQGRIEAPLGRTKRDRKLFGVVEGGKEAATRYRTLESFTLLSLLEIQLETGRTHQIRIHLKYAGHPVFGDPLYGGRNRRLGPLSTPQRAFISKLFRLITRQALHAAVLGFLHPVTRKRLRFESEFPLDIKRVLDLLHNENSNLSPSFILPEET